MKVELKNFKYAEFASHETHCYSATVYVDGKRAFLASNEGHGGADHYEPLKSDAASRELMIESMLKITTAHPFKEEWHEGGNCDGTILRSSACVESCEMHHVACHACLEIFMGNLINDMLIAKDVKKLLKKKVLFTDGDTRWSNCYKGGKAPDQRLIDHIAEQHPDCVILNSLAFDEAVEFFKQVA